MITKQQAIESKYREEFHHVTRQNADGTPMRCRVNGKCKTWKTRPNDFSLPVKYGLKTCFYINETNCKEWVKITIATNMHNWELGPEAKLPEMNCRELIQ